MISLILFECGVIIPEVAATLSILLSDEKSKDKTFGLLSKTLKHTLYEPASCVKYSNFPSFLLLFSSTLLPFGLNNYINYENLMKSRYDYSQINIIFIISRNYIRSSEIRCII